MLREPGPVIVIDRFEPMLAALLDLLGDLSDAEWAAPVSPAWTVKDLAQHLLGGDVGILSRHRDAYRPGGAPIERWEDLVALINALNESWVVATRRMSPRLLRDMLAVTGPQVTAYFAALDPMALGEPVSWAGPAPAPVWLDLAREYTERWHHQQQIRDAVGRPGLKGPHFLGPALDAFVRALPHTYRAVAAPEGRSVALTITGDAGGQWLLRREAAGWQLYVGEGHGADAHVEIDQETAWRLFTRGVSQGEAAARARLSGDPALGSAALAMVSVIA